MRRFLARLPLNLLSLLLLFDLAHLGQDHLPEDCATSNLAEAAPLPSGVRSSVTICTRRIRRSRCISVSRGTHVDGTRDVLLVLFVHLERLDAVGKLDNLDAAAETRAGNVGANLGQQIAVAGGFTGQPLMLQSYIGCHSLAGVWLEEGEDKVFGVLGDILPVALVEDDAARPAFFDKVGQALGAEGRVTTQESVSDHAQRPHVDGLAVALLEHDLGSSVAEGARHAGEYFGGVVQHFRDTEICQDKLRVGGTCEVEEILGFQVYASSVKP